MQEKEDIPFMIAHSMAGTHSESRLPQNPATA